MIELIWFLIGMAFIEAILKPTIVYFTQKETRRIKAIADLLMPELMARTDPYMPDWIKSGKETLAWELWTEINETAQDKGLTVDAIDLPKIVEQFTSLYSVFENAKEFDREIKTDKVIKLNPQQE